MTPDAIYTALTALITGGSLVYAAARGNFVKALKVELADMTARWEDARAQAHAARDHGQALEIQNTELRMRTNFEPVREKLEDFMSEQRKVNNEQREFNGATLKAMQQISTNQEHLSKTLINILEKFVPPLTEAELKFQEEKI